jgi:hypothetical protein
VKVGIETQLGVFAVGQTREGRLRLARHPADMLPLVGLNRVAKHFKSEEEGGPLALLAP